MRQRRIDWNSQAAPAINVSCLLQSEAFGALVLFSSRVQAQSSRKSEIDRQRAVNSSGKPSWTWQVAFPSSSMRRMPTASHWSTALMRATIAPSRASVGCADWYSSPAMDTQSLAGGVSQTDGPGPPEATSSVCGMSTPPWSRCAVYISSYEEIGKPFG